MAHSIKIGNGNETKYKSRPDINARAEEVKVRPDWNQIDPNAPDYINNRPFGPIRKIETVRVYEFTIVTSNSTLVDYGFAMCNKVTVTNSSDKKFSSDYDHIYCTFNRSINNNVMYKAYELPRLVIPAGALTTNETYGYGNPAYYTYDENDDNDLPILMVKSDNDGDWIVIIDVIVRPDLDNEITFVLGTTYEEKEVINKMITEDMISDFNIGSYTTYLKSSTPGSNKKFRLTVDDSGTLTAVEYT